MEYTINPNNFNPVMEVCVCLLEFDGKFVVLLRPKGKSKGETWCLPGGKGETNEEISAAVIREVWEEINVGLSKHELTQVCSLKVRDGKDFIYNVFHAKLSSMPKINLNKEEHINFNLVSPQESLLLPLTPPLKNVVEMVYRL